MDRWKDCKMDDGWMDGGRVMNGGVCMRGWGDGRIMGEGIAEMII